MKTLSEIIDQIKSGDKPTYDELLYSVLALESLHDMDIRSFYESTKQKAMMKKLCIEESFRRNKNAYCKNPKKWLGVENDPENHEYQKMRELSIKILKKLQK